MGVYQNEASLGPCSGGNLAHPGHEMHQELAAAVLSPGISTHRATGFADLNQRTDHGPKAHHAGKSKNCGDDDFFHLFVPFQADAALSEADLRCLPQR